MGRYKCAYNCENSSDSDLKYFKFPLYNPRKLKKWLNNMKWDDWTPSRFSVLCSNHFEEHYIDRTGKCVKLKEDAIPTIFSSPNSTQKENITLPLMQPSDKRRSKQSRTSTVKASQMNTAQSPTNTPATTKISAQNKQPSQTEEPVGDKEPKTHERWRIIVDEALMKIQSFPHFFHGDYCVPQRDVQWAPDLNLNAEVKDPENLIEVTEPWQWLGLDIRGPLPETPNTHKYMLTVTDYYSKWVEALPMQACLPEQVVEHVVDIIAHFGYPIRMLSRLPHHLVQKINRDLKEQLKITVSLVVYHQQTGSTDLITEQLIDRMVSDLIEEHAPDWDIHLPAKVFSLCCAEHSQTKERPFSVLCCKEQEPVRSPREPNWANSKIQESAFLVR